MKNTDEEWSDGTDAWFLNAETVAKQVELNEQRHVNARRRQNITFAFVVFAFFLLAWRQELNSHKISRNGERIVKQQEVFQMAQLRSCTGSLTIIFKYNALLEEQIKIEKSNTFINEALRQKRIAAYKAAEISPPPTCDKLTGVFQ